MQPYNSFLIRTNKYHQSVALAYSTLSAVKNNFFDDPGFDDPGFDDPGFDDPRGAVAWIAARWRPGDHIYASGAGLPPIIYYGLRQANPVVHLNFVSPRSPAYTPNSRARWVPLPTKKGRPWLLFFIPDEADYDRMVLRHFGVSALPIERSCFKHYVVSLWLLG